MYATRLLAAPPQRLFEESFSIQQWRQGGFYPVLNERKSSPQANRDSSLMYQMLQLKKQHRGTNNALLDDSFDLSLHRAQSCPKIDEFPCYAATKPSWGMPFGLPALNNQEHDVVTKWLQQGAHFADTASAGAIMPADVASWETFLNGSSLKEQLVSRYIYEHLFLANLYFAQQPCSFYRMIRSATPPGQIPVKISTRRPYDDPLVSRVFYRLERYQGTILAKNHLPYELSPQRMERYSELFVSRPFAVITFARVRR